MQNMLEWLTPLIKEAELSTESFINAVGLNRTLFYRGTKSPQKLSDDVLKKMAQVLGFDQERETQLFAFKQMPDPVEQKIRNLINEIVFTSNSSTSNSQAEFSYYEKNNSDTLKLSAESLANLMVSKALNQISRSSGCGVHHSLHVTIYNCVSESVLSTLSDLFYSLENASNIPGDTQSLRIAHFIHPQTNSSDNYVLSRLTLMKKLTPMTSMFSDYSYLEERLGNPIWDKNDDLCLIRYRCRKLDSGNDYVDNYFLLNVSKGHEAYVTSFDDEHLYRYFRMDARGLSFESMPKIGALNMNLKLFEASLNHRKILVTHNYCFDNIPRSMWQDVFDRAVPEVKQILAHVCDPRNFFSGLDTEQKLDLGLEFLGKRAEANDKHEVVNILFAWGLEEFVSKRYISDCDIPINPENPSIRLGEKIRFEPKAIVFQLRETQKRLGDKAEPRHQKYYLVRHFSKTHNNPIMLFENEFMLSYNPRSNHVLDGTRIVEEKEAINAIFQYVYNELIDKRNDTDSFLMSDDEAFTYIERLIQRLNTHYNL